MIASNIKEVRENIKRACERVGRDVSEVTLICVSKTKPLELLQEAYEAGEKEFGENKVQEILSKKPNLPEDAVFHMIGHLQTNKVKQVVDKAAWIHSVDSVRLAEKISEESVKKGLITKILLEVNVAEEESKYGFLLNELSDAISLISKLPGVSIQGLMTVAPFVDDAEENRPVFRKLYDFYIDTKLKNIDNVSMNALSMGMTGDYEVAIEEGATMVRVGTGIFGARDYTN